MIPSIPNAVQFLLPGPVDLDRTITKQPPKVEEVLREAGVNRRLSLNPLVEESVKRNM